MSLSTPSPKNCVQLRVIGYFSAFSNFPYSYSPFLPAKYVDFENALLQTVSA